MSKSKIKLIWGDSSWYCELCGTIFDQSLEVTLDGETVLNLASDGHFGGGDDLDDCTSIINKILPAIGSTMIHMEIDSEDHRNDVIEKALIGLGYDVTTEVQENYDLD